MALIALISLNFRSVKVIKITLFALSSAPGALVSASGALESASKALERDLGMPKMRWCFTRFRHRPHGRIDGLGRQGGGPKCVGASLSLRSPPYRLQGEGFGGGPSFAIARRGVGGWACSY